MMATCRGDDAECAAASPACECKKDGHDPSELSPMSPMSPVDQLFSWPGPKTLHLHRTSQVFGFTLRHFIVYPPESAIHSSFKEEDSGGRGRPRCRLEPMDTIFVKQVKEGGSAHQAGLCTGDRIVKVNSESIIGKTYSQVIALIQNSDSSLELCVMPKDEDILQLAYSKDAYLKGNEAYSGNAQDIPEPPPVCYPRIELKTSVMTHTDEPSAPSGAHGVLSQGAEPSSAVGCCVEVPITQLPQLPPSPPASQVSKLQTVPCAYDESVWVAGDDVSDSLECSPNICGTTSNHRLQETKKPPLCTTSFENLSSVRPRSQTTPCSSSARGTQLHYTPKRPAESPGFSAHIPVHTHFHPDCTSTPFGRHAMSPFKPSPLAVASSPCSPMHQNIDWRNYTTYKEYIDNKRLYTYGSRTIQERLDSLRAASQANNQATMSTEGMTGSQTRQRSTCHERGPANSGVQSLCSMSQERLEVKERATSRDWHRSASQDALSSSTKSAYKPRARSCDYLGRQAESRVSLMDRRVYGRTETNEKALICTGEETRGCRQSLSLGKVPQSQRAMVGVACGSFPGLNAKSQGTDVILSSRVKSLGNASPARFPIQTSLLDDSYVAKALASLNTGVTTASVTTKNQRTALVPKHTSPGRQAENHQQPIGAIPYTDHSRGQRTQQDEFSVAAKGSAVEGLEGAEATVVVVRREKIKKSGTLPLRHLSYIQAVNDGADRVEKVTKAEKCLTFNDAEQDGCKQWLSEEYNPSGSGQLHESLDSIPFIDEPSSPSADLDDTRFPVCTIISAAPLSPTSSSSTVLHRQLSHDQDSLRLTGLDSDSGAKTERSKSCDEGLDTYRDEGHGKLKHITSLRGLRKTVDRSSEDSGSRRNSLSDVNTTKEGILHFRQFSSDKGKRVSGGMRSWKQMYAVLRGHSLYLYKDKKEGAIQNSHTEEEPVAISIKACLIDISYSDTKRKNVLRLTTSDCEYLFQAEDREDMLAWIHAIQGNSNLDQENALITSTDLINRKIKEYNTLMSPTSSKTEPSPRSSRQSLSIRHTLLGNRTPSPHSPPKELERKLTHRDEASPPKDKGQRRKGIPGLMRKTFEKKVPPGVTFGVRLDDCPPANTNRFVPLIVEVCCKLVEERGLEYTGIYRVPGNNAAISSMQEELNRGVGEIDIQEDKWKDLNVISSLLKSFFRKLPDPLFTNERYGDFIEANRTEDPVDRLKVLKRLLHELPDHHYETLKFLSAHLKTVAENSEKNKMEPRNLAIVFGPTLVRTSEDNMTHMVTHMPDQYKIVETLIQQYDWFFTDDGEEEPETVVQTDSAVETQPVPNIDHLLTNIGRTGVSPGEVSDSPTSDSAKSKGSWGSGKDQYNRELVSSIFAAANRKRKKPKERLHISSSDDDLDAVFLESELQNRTEQIIAGDSHDEKGPEKTTKGRREHRNSFFLKKQSPGKMSESQKYSTLPSLRLRNPAPSKSTTSESPAQVEDLSTMSPGMTGSRNRQRIWDVVAPDLPPTGPAGGSATAEVSSITSDYSTTSSMTFLTGAESSMVSADLQSRAGDDADDERSEMVSEGRHMETDSETEFPVFNRGATTPTKMDARQSECATVRKPVNRCFLPAQRLYTFNTLSKRRSLSQKTDSDSSLEVGASREGERIIRNEPNRLSRVLEAVKKGRSAGSISSASSSSHSQTEQTKRLSIAEKIKSHFRLSADDMFGVGSHKNSRKKEKRVRRRHTVGGQQDFGELAVINDWREQGGMEKGAELSDTDRLKFQKSREVSVQDWITREHWHPGTSRALSEPPKVAGTGEGSGHPASTASCQSSTDQLNGGEPKSKGKANLNSGSDAHPHKLSGAQVVRSQFYQCL